MATSHIRSQFEADENNRKIVFTALGAAGALPDDVAELYELHYRAIANQLPDRPAEVAAALYVACRKHLVLAMCSLLRRYSSPAFRETRAAVEAAGIANAIRMDNENLRIFMGDRDDKARKAARKRFVPATLFVGELVRLRQYYDKASELSHTTRRTFVTHVNLEQGTFSYQDLQEKDIPRLATNYLLWICGAHVTILEMADIVFADAQGELVEKFKVERHFVYERICRFNLKNEGEIYQPDH